MKFAIAPSFSLASLLSPSLLPAGGHFFLTFLVVLFCHFCSNARRRFAEDWTFARTVRVPSWKLSLSSAIKNVGRGFFSWLSIKECRICLHHHPTSVELFPKRILDVRKKLARERR